MINMKQKLTKNGVELSKICLGTWKISQESYNPRFMANLIEKAILSGITTIDTADIYGNYKTEELIGDSIKNLKIERDKFQIVTKCNIVKNHPDFSNIKNMCYDSSFDYIRYSVNRSLEKLKVDYVDLFLLHRIDYLLNPYDVNKAISQLKKEGKIKSFGVSNFSYSKMKMLQQRIEEPIQTNQIEFSLKNFSALDDGVLDLCLEMGISPMFWSPFGNGKIFQDEKIMDILNQLKNKYQVENVATIVLAALFKHPANGIAVVGTLKEERFSSYIESLKINLTNDDFYALLSAAGKFLP